MKNKPITKQRNFRVSLRQVVDAKPALDSLVKMRFPAAVSFKIGRLVSALQAELKMFGERRDELARRYGTPSADDPNVLTITPKARGEWERDLGVLLSVEVSPAAEPLAELDLEKSSEGLTVLDVLLLKPLIK